MYQQERIDEILKLLRENHYLTVDYLVKKINYSPASIRRDLTILEKQGMVVRSYGGVRLGDANISPFRFRQHSMKIAKNAISKMASTLVRDNDVVFLDGSSTTQYMGRFLIDKKNITVITCNMILADFLSEHGVITYCTGGRVVEHPGILGGQLMAEFLSNFNVDIAFFSTFSFSLDGKILTTDEKSIIRHNIFRNSTKKLVYLCGSDKFDAKAQFVSMTLDKIDYFISDGKLSEELKEKYKKTTFISTR